MPPELSAVASHLTFVSSFKSSDGRQIVTNYLVDESFDTFLEELKPQLVAGGWSYVNGVVQIDGGDRELDFNKFDPNAEVGDTAATDQYKLADNVGSSVDKKSAKNVMLYHFAPIKQE